MSKGNAFSLARRTKHVYTVVLVVRFFCIEEFSIRTLREHHAVGRARNEGSSLIVVPTLTYCYFTEAGNQFQQRIVCLVVNPRKDLGSEDDKQQASIGRTDSVMHRRDDVIP